MYLYLYDSFLNDNKHYKTLSRIEMRLTDLGIGGKISRLSPLKNIKELISDEIRFGVKTIVAVGNDETVSKTINNIANYTDITFGIIPIGPNQKIAEALGIAPEEAACDILSARKIEKLDLGRVNNTYFISGVNIEAESQIRIEFENSYQIMSEANTCQINIRNLRPAFSSGIGPKYFNPRDGVLEALIEPIKGVSRSFFRKKTPSRTSVIPFKKISVLSKKSVTVRTDGQKILKPPVDIEVVPNKLSVIVGRKNVYF